MLQKAYQEQLMEAGCDEAGRGCLAGPVFAAAVIFPPDYENTLLNDSKKLSEKQREHLRRIIEKDAVSYSVAQVDNGIIDKINILNASFLAMHLAIDKLALQPELLLIDGNRFKPYKKIPHICVVKGDAKFMSIAAASILAKTYRDAFMQAQHDLFPQYGWNQNKGYPTEFHRKAILQHGQSSLHRRSFSMQLKIDF